METTKCNSTFEYSFCAGSDRSTLNLKIPINIEELQPKNVPEFSARLINFHQIPCFIETGLTASLKNYVNKEINKLNNEKSSANIEIIRKDPNLISNIAKTISEKYKKTCVKYADSVSNSTNEFAQAYHYLIHSAAMPMVLKLETKYHSVLTKLLSTKDQCVAKMQERQQLEMARMCENVGFAYTNQDVTVLASKHLADTERLSSQLEFDYSSTIQRQRKEFHEVVLNLYHEMKNNDDNIDDSGPAYNKVKQIIDETVAITRNTNGVDGDSQTEVSSPSQSSIAGSSGIHMEESFTINLGAQLKTMHNVRLLVTDILNFCRYFDEREAEAQRFQSAMSLYSNSLSAVIIFSDKRLRYPTGIQKEFSTICMSSNEFHFTALSDQLNTIENEVVKCGQSTADRQDEGYLHLNEGDFYITKHSNLSQVHVVFHVVVDESSLQTKTSLSSVTSRHPAITSLRQILKVCSSHDIATLTLPLLLTHELTEEITFQWCIKRAELVMKCVKGFMMEMATLDGGVSRTIQFVVPPGISEEAFDSMRSTLPEVFRTTSTRDLTRSRSSVSK